MPSFSICGVEGFLCPHPACIAAGMAQAQLPPASHWSLNRNPIHGLSWIRLKISMIKKCLSVLAFAGVALVCNSSAQYADYVAAYNPDTGASAGFTNPITVLGEPTRIGVNPFSPAFRNSQILS